MDNNEANERLDNWKDKRDNLEKDVEQDFEELYDQITDFFKKHGENPEVGKMLIENVAMWSCNSYIEMFGIFEAAKYFIAMYDDDEDDED